MKRIEITKALLKNLTSRQKLELLHKELTREKNSEDRKQILNLISAVKREQRLLRDSIKQFESKRPQEKKQEIKEEEQEVQAEPLEEIIEEESQNIQPQENNKIEMYGLEKANIEYLAPVERKKQQYQTEATTFSHERFTGEGRKKLKKQEEESHRRHYTVK